MIKHILSAALAAFIAGPAAAGCPTIAAQLADLDTGFGEQAVVFGRSLGEDGNANGVMLLTANSEHKTWTILVVTPNGACITLFGDGLEAAEVGQ
ncbi:hypothetical protein D1114_07200 [Cereibacter sphaeroides]|uniref:Lipoprotein n=1 Tax=Cereibacter sphaeroides TaxID=1063 RepID=A0AAX1UNN5_CERSP|nr:hypothetical protein [Cereibacter sphaeroides]RHZ96488.1 hypothetical protein D1114_07200 [Cereibacter sphaeroides]